MMRERLIFIPVKKSLLLIAFGGTILILGLTFPGGPDGQDRVPVPAQQKVAHSSHCSGCHGVDETGLALVDGAGNDVSIFDDWQISMMGLASRDPFWRATVTHEVNLYPSAQSAIETTCLKCHAPLGSFESRRLGQPYTFENMLSDTLGLDGVSCSACHQQPANAIGNDFSGNYTLDTNRILFGHYPNPFKGPMQIYVGFEPEFSDHIYSSGVCAGCHTLVTETLQPDGMPSGNFFVEQATYHEWLNSSFSSQGKECQSCHMPFINDEVIIATDFAALEPRQPYGLHQFFGANTAMLELMRDNQETLNLPHPEGSHAWDESITNNRKSLASAAELDIASMYVFGDTLYLSLSVRNRSGHKLPSGYPSRLAWLELSLQVSGSKDLIYVNGQLDENGNIEGRDLPYEPHHEISRSSDDVQIYEMAMSDLSGHLTTRLNAAFEPLKDNRLLPLGFNRNHSAYDTVAVWGEATSDPDYSAQSSDGMDRIEYRIPLQGHKGFGSLEIKLNYQTLPARWMADLFTNDTLELVGQFKSMYQDYKAHHELIDMVLLDSIDLSTSAISPVLDVLAFSLKPNPTDGQWLDILLNHGYGQLENLRYQITDIEGKVLQAASFSERIDLPPSIKKGVYYYALFDQRRLIAVKPFVVL